MHNHQLKTNNRTVAPMSFSGTLDINVCKIENEKLTIQTVHGDDHLGKITFNILFIICLNLHFNRGSRFRWNNYELCITRIYGIIE